MTDHHLFLRHACEQDLDAMASLLRVLFSIEQDFTVDNRRQQQGLQLMLENPRGCVLVAEISGVVVGMCTGQLTISTAEGGLSLLIEDVVVSPEWQRRGIGKRLILEISEWGKEKGAKRMQLLADSNNERALIFYKGLGWQITRLICLNKF